MTHLQYFGLLSAIWTAAFFATSEDRPFAKTMTFIFAMLYQALYFLVWYKAIQ